MPPFQPRSRGARRGRRAVRALLLAASALAFCAQAAAQELDLRGEVPENVLSNPSGNADDNTASIPGDEAAADPGNPDTDADEASAPASDDPAAATVDNSAFSDDPAPKPKLRRHRPIRQDTDEEAPPPKKPTKRTDLARSSAKTVAAGLESDTADTAESDQFDPLALPANPRVKPLDADERQPLDKGAERTGSIEGLNGRREDDPFAAVGIRAGTFVLRPTLEQGLTATSNADSSYKGRSALLSETTLRLNAVSDWRQHSANADGYLTYRKTLSGEDVEDVRGRVQGTLNLDLAHDLRTIAKLGYEAAPESASSPVVIEDTVSQPLRQTLDASLGLEKYAGKARIGLTGAVERDTYGDARLASGAMLSQKGRDNTLYTATLRGGYEISPALTPFLEIETGRRLYDQRVDDSGYERSATRLGARAGLELDMGEKLGGEFSAGWLRESIDDDRLAAIAGLSINANLKWSPVRGTTVGLSGATTVEGTTTPGESGSLLYSGRLSLERQMRTNLTGAFALSADYRDYVGSAGHDLTLGAEGSLTWWLSRYAGLTTRLRTEKLTSNLPGREETTNSIFVGLRLQR